MKTTFITAIYDNKAERFFAMNTSRTPADFIRSVQVEAKNSQSMLHQFPSDYELYVLSEWDEKQGIILTEKKRLGSVLDLCPLS
ncbi:MAG: DNA binding protein [Microviridae sp. ctITQ3]|nr:MAG: DNA binding protein [Microviridae sp. ctITQ3]